MKEKGKKRKGFLPFLYMLIILAVRIEIAKSSFSQQTASPFSLTFFVSKESYKETASLLKKDYYLLPSLNSFFKGDGCADGSFRIVERGTNRSYIVYFVFIPKLPQRVRVR